MIGQDLNRPVNEFGYDEKVLGGCGLAGIISVKKRMIPGEQIIKAIALMHDRGNGLGGGFAVYGIYPQYRDYYAFHLMYDSDGARTTTELLLKKNFHIAYQERIPTQVTKTIKSHPDFYRYFVLPREDAKKELPDKDDGNFIVSQVMHINGSIDGAFVVSSGKNMGAFKGVGFPEDIAEFFKLHEYKGYCWTAHNRFPTNTPGWWGGAHPFTLLDWAIVHNGEISSYGINKRYLEMYGYRLTMLTDTEVVTYLFDLLVRRHGLSFETAVTALAAPFWKNIDRMEEGERKAMTALRMVYGSALLNGPFAVILSHNNGFIGLSDRIKLRPLVAAKAADLYYLSSEESAIRKINRDLEKVWFPRAGEPVIVNYEEEGK